MGAYENIDLDFSETRKEFKNKDIHSDYHCFLIGNILALVSLKDLDNGTFAKRLTQAIEEAIQAIEEAIYSKSHGSSKISVIKDTSVDTSAVLNFWATSSSTT